VGQGGGGDPEVVRADWPATSAEIGPDFGMNAGNGLGNRKRLQPRQHVLDEGTAPRSVRSRSPGNAVEQLAHRNDADRSMLVTDQCLERRRSVLPFPVD
jgi:hypothetical protein